MIKNVVLLISILCTSCVAANRDDYYAKLNSISGLNAVNCGEIQALTIDKQPLIQTNTCVSDSYINNLSFHATYIYQGHDTYTLHGFAYNKNNNTLYFVEFNRGFNMVATSKLTVEECKGAVFQGSVDVDYHALFSCS